MLFLNSSASGARPASDADALQMYCDRVALALDNAFLHEMLHKNLKVRGTILAVVSHDLNNPLNAILLKTERILHRGLSSTSESSVLNMMKSVHVCAMRIHRLAQDLVDVSCVERNALSMRRDRVQVSDIVEQATDVAKEKSATKGIVLQVLAEDVEQELCWCDRQRILQVLGNLLDNAIKFTPDGGHVILKVSRNDDKHLRFSVEDTGEGLEGADMQQMFEQFWQQQDKAALGHGLGLYISRGIVVAHGGNIWADNAEHGGARVAFTLPCDRIFKEKEHDQP